MEAVVGTAMRRKPESTLTEDNLPQLGLALPDARCYTSVNARWGAGE